MEGVKHYGLQQSWHFQEQIDRCFSLLCFIFGHKAIGVSNRGHGITWQASGEKERDDFVSHRNGLMIVTLLKLLGPVPPTRKG